MFVNNFIPVIDSAMPWSWSLAVEEQFYLVLPLLIIPWLTRFKTPVLAILILCAASLFIRWLLLTYYLDITGVTIRELMFDSTAFNHYFYVMYSNLYSRFGELMVGVLGAYLYVFHKGPISHFAYSGIGRFLVCLSSVIALALLFYGGFQFDPNSLGYFENERLRNIYIVSNRLIFALSVITILLYFNVKGGVYNSGEFSIEERRKSRFHASLKFTAFWSFYARLSYSIYLFHPFVIFPVFSWVYHYCLSAAIDGGALYYCLIPAATLAAMAISTMLSMIIYVVWEKPFLRMG